MVIGAGPAGLAAAWAGRQRGLEPLILERSDQVGGAWARMDPEMRCLSPRIRDAMPDGALPHGSGPRATAREIHEAIGAFADRARFNIAFGVEATALAKGPPMRLTTTTGELRAERLVVATGEYARPHRPPLVGVFGGQLRHSCELDPDSIPNGARVIVVGAGNTGAELAVRLAARGAAVTICSRKPIRRPSPEPSGLLGELAWWLSGTPIVQLPGKGGCADHTPIVDPDLFDAIAEGHVREVGAACGLVRDGVRLADGAIAKADEVILATGFRRDVAWLEGTVSMDSLSIPKNDRGVSPEIRGLGFVGIPCMRTRRSGFLRGFVGDGHAVVSRLIRA